MSHWLWQLATPEPTYCQASYYWSISMALLGTQTEPKASGSGRGRGFVAENPVGEPQQKPVYVRLLLLLLLLSVYRIEQDKISWDVQI